MWWFRWSFVNCNHVLGLYDVKITRKSDAIVVECVEHYFQNWRNRSPHSCHWQWMLLNCQMVCPGVFLYSQRYQHYMSVTTFVFDATLHIWTVLVFISRHNRSVLVFSSRHNRLVLVFSRNRMKVADSAHFETQFKNESTKSYED